MMRLFLLPLLALVSLTAAAAAAQEQVKPPVEPPPRWGVIAGIGLGFGDGDVNCSVCGGASHSGPSLHARLGGVLRRDLLLVAELDDFSTSRPALPTEATTSLSALNVVLQWYPGFTQGYFIAAGLGGGRVKADLASAYSGETVSPIGPAFKLGTGYDIMVSRSLAVTPFASFVYVHGGTTTDASSYTGTQRMSGNVLLFGVEATLAPFSIAR